ncbi:hypothetical protein NW762_009148 [Fusarium torreyae]|uniref:CFEM domain-containing protein n=1 Tax=Fusarium torreyae TaxID=1237075 RepID=A0A9W8RXY2_9HYPO|nr:hypothetical protein NW762_009148 [Fusarium torreyae]
MAATTTTAYAHPTTLPGLVSEVPACAMSCFDSVASSIDCKPTDLECLCSSLGRFVAKMTPCIALGDCDLDQTSNATDLIRPICDKMSNYPDSPEVASASSVLAEAVASGTETAAPSETSDNAAAHKTYGIGIVMAAVGAAVLL